MVRQDFRLQPFMTALMYQHSQVSYFAIKSSTFLKESVTLQQQIIQFACIFEET